ncbi:MAG: TetR/AcrR family transcriptional regulator [Chloroflexota bacterium]
MTKSYHHGRLRETLIEAGIAILEEEGIHALSLRKVAKRAQVSHAAPYRHFDDKIALLCAIAEDGFKQLVNNIEQIMLETAEDPRLQLFELGHSYINFGIEHPAQLTLMFSDLLKTGTSQSLSDTAGYTFELLKRSVEFAQAANVIKDGDPTQLARTFWAMEHGLAMLMKEGFFDGEGDEFRKHAITKSLADLMVGLEA